MENAISEEVLRSWADIHALFTAAIREWPQIREVALSYAHVVAALIGVGPVCKANLYASIYAFISELQPSTTRHTVMICAVSKLTVWAVYNTCLR
jgi:hypothetical protein